MITRNKKKTILYQQEQNSNYSIKKQQDTQQNDMPIKKVKNLIPKSSVGGVKIVGRQSQIQRIDQFLYDCLLNKITAKVLYISGVPGVGKTLTTLNIVQQFVKQLQNIRMKYINAMQLKNPKDIYSVILSQINSQKRKLNKTEVLISLEKKLQKMSQNLIIIVDEVDYLMTNDQSIFYNMFEWANNISKLCIILIGNTIDFPQKMTGKVISRMGNNRTVFKPYTRQQIQKIILYKLKQNPNFNKKAINYACKKMCTMTSDLRKILKVIKIVQESNKTSQIGVEQISKVWSEIIQNQEQWFDKLPSFFQKIMNAIKLKHGFSDSQDIFSIMRNEKPYRITEIQYGLRQLVSMGIIKSQETTKDGFAIQKITLIKNF